VPPSGRKKTSFKPNEKVRVNGIRKTIKREEVEKRKEVA
jgi:hypothetical protein